MPIINFQIANKTEGLRNTLTGHVRLRHDLKWKLKIDCLYKIKDFLRKYGSLKLIIGGEPSRPPNLN